MKTGSLSRNNLPFLADLSPKDRRTAEKALDHLEDRERKAQALRREEAEGLSEEFRRRLHDLLGGGKRAELRKGMREAHLAFRDLLQPPGGLDRDYRKENARRRRKGDELLRKLGADPESIAALGREFQERLRPILSAAEGKVVRGFNLPQNLGQWTKLSPLHDLPLPWGVISPDIDPDDPHRWVLLRPPFFGFLFSFVPVASPNFVVDRLLHLNPSAALVGNEVTMDCGDAGDFDYASGTAEAQIAFAFEPPVAGVVEVLIDAQSTIGTHDLRMEDEWGWSNSSTGQSNFLMMNVLHPNVPEPSLALMSAFQGKFDGDDSSEHRENLVRGQHYFAHLFSAGPVPAGETVIVTAGTRTFDSSGTNDVEVHSRSNFQWFINSVEVRISP